MQLECQNLRYLSFSLHFDIFKHLSSIDIDIYAYFTWDRKRGIIISHSSFFLPLLCQAAVHPAPYLNRQLMWNTPYKQNLIKTLLLSLKLFPDQVLSWLNGNLWLHLVDHIPYVTFAVFLDFLIGQISQYHDLKVTKMPKLFIKMDHEFRDAFNITFEFNLLILFFLSTKTFWNKCVFRLEVTSVYKLLCLSIRPLQL